MHTKAQALAAARRCQKQLGEQWEIQVSRSEIPGQGADYALYLDRGDAVFLVLKPAWHDWRYVLCGVSLPFFGRLYGDPSRSPRKAVASALEKARESVATVNEAMQWIEGKVAGTNL